MRKGAAIVGSLVISITALSLALSRIAISNEPTPLLADGAIVEANTIESIPDLARAVLTGDRKEVDRWLLKGANVDERVHAKNGARAGFTPIILAAAISDSQIAKMLIENKANITLLDDFHRSAFWYAALNQSDAVTEVLVTARDANDVINDADDDLKRTPLHLAVRGNEVETVKLLLTKGASRSRSLEDIRGETPVDYCKRRPNDACRLLF
jgi:ankyrin repeat protein